MWFSVIVLLVIDKVSFDCSYTFVDSANVWSYFTYFQLEIKLYKNISWKYEARKLKVLGKSVGVCKTTKRKDQLYISLLVSVWRIICENFNPNGLILAEIWMKI